MIKSGSQNGVHKYGVKERKKKLKAIQRKYDEQGEGSKENGRLKKKKRTANLDGRHWKNTMVKIVTRVSEGMNSRINK